MLFLLCTSFRMVIVLPQYVGSYVDLFGNDLGLYEYVLYVFTLSAVQKIIISNSVVLFLLETRYIMAGQPTPPLRYPLQK